jgi:hypothetical protein
MTSASSPTADTLWVHMLRQYVKGGDAAKLGPHATAVLLTLKSHCDLVTGATFPSVDRVARLSGVSRRQVIRAYAALRTAGYLESDPPRRGVRGRHRLVERVPILDAGKQVAVAVWPYIPLRQEEARQALAVLLASGTPLPVDGVLNLTVALQIVEPGGFGLQVVEAAPQTQAATSSRQAEFRAWARANAKCISPETLKKWGQGGTKK